MEDLAGKIVFKEEFQESFDEIIAALPNEPTDPE
jgi:hypothetical protein